jgi:hypothetical protein
VMLLCEALWMSRLTLSSPLWSVPGHPNTTAFWINDFFPRLIVVPCSFLSSMPLPWALSNKAAIVLKAETKCVSLGSPFTPNQAWCIRDRTKEQTNKNIGRF